MALVLAAMALPAHAQQTATTPLGRIVFGWGTDQVALDTPQAVTVIDQEEIEQQQATQVGEFFDGVPSVQGIGSDRPLGGTFNIRGWGEVPAGDEGRVVVLQDGATQYYEQYRIGSFFSDPNLFCNIEVLRGPASATLYGSGAIGGVIRFETCDAEDYLTDGQTSQFRFSVGGETNGEGGNIALRYATRLNDNLDLFANLNYREAADYVDGGGDTIDGSAFDATSGVISATYHFSSTRSLRLIYEVWNSDLDDTEYEQTGSNGSFGQVDRRTNDTTFSAIYESAESFGDLEATLAYSNTTIAQENATSASSSVLFEDTDYGYETLSLDARVTTEGSFGNVNVTTTYGATISRQLRTAEAETSTFIDFHPEGTATRLALFAQSELDFGNGLTLIPGLRLEYVMNEPGDDNPATTFDARESAELLLVSPKVAFTYDVSDEFGLFGSVARTQRAPTLDELYSYDPPSATAPLGETAALDLDMETADGIELGFTYSTAGLLNANDAFDVRVTSFYTIATDLIARDTADGTPSYRNIDEARIWGLEIEAAYVSDLFYGNLAISALDGTRDAAGDVIWSQMPQDTLSLTLGHRNVETGWGVGWTMNAYADIDYVDTTSRGVTSDNRFGGYTTHDVFASYAPQSGPLEGFEARAGVYNAFDRSYRNALDDENGRGVSARLTLARVWNF